ncbi:MAG: hypothetical protein JRH20_28465 [Deltaproteobacteria bacterium]|nr:hypothetical protein [Deltaproteobacteria bacterium]
MTDHAAATTPPVAKPRPHLAFQVIAIIGTLASCSGFYFTMSEIAAILDGPGVGMFNRGPGGSTGVFTSMWLVGFCVFVLGAVAMRNWRRATAIALGGFVFCIVLFVSMTAQRIFGVTWANRCEAGDVWFCYAAGGIHKHVLGGDAEARTKGNRFYLKGCKLVTLANGSDARPGYERDLDRSWSANSCRRLLEDKGIGGGVRTLACNGLSSICALNKKSACERRQKTCLPSIAKGDEKYCGDLRRECFEGDDACSDAVKMGCGDQEATKNATTQPQGTTPRNVETKGPKPDKGEHK